LRQRRGGQKQPAPAGPSFPQSPNPGGRSWKIIIFKASRESSRRIEIKNPQKNFSLYYEYVARSEILQNILIYFLFSFGGRGKSAKKGEFEEVLNSTWQN
jgi:hypothetical protein